MNLPRMKLSLLLCFLLAGTGTYAQQVALGLRASGNYYMQRGAGKPGIKAMDGTHMTVAPEVFVRYQTKSRWAAEFAVNTQRIEQQYWWAGHNTDAAVYYPGSYQLRTSRYIDATLSLQREIRCSKMASLPGMKNLHSYIGVTAGITNVQGKDLFVSSRESSDGYSGSNEYWYHWIGLMKTVRYDVNRKFSVIGAGHCSADPGKLFSEYNGQSQPSLRFSLKLGASYNW